MTNGIYFDLFQSEVNLGTLVINASTERKKPENYTLKCDTKCASDVHASGFECIYRRTHQNLPLHGLEERKEGKLTVKIMLSRTFRHPTPVKLSSVVNSLVVGRSLASVTIRSKFRHFGDKRLHQKMET